MASRRAMKIVLRRGDLASSSACALVTSANDSLVPNGLPTYWRFISRQNVDGALRQLAGPELDRACEAIEPLTGTGFRRDITRWTSGVKHGVSLPVRCPAGSAVSTKASGRLKADHVVHTVAPDSEFGFEGIYTGGYRDQLESGAVAGVDTPRRFTGQQFTPPDHLLLSSYASAFAEASRLGASTVACPALGAGVKGWKPAIAATLGLEAAARLAARPRADGAEAPASLQFVIGGVSSLADACWRDWARVAHTLLGAPSGLDRPDEYAEATRRGVELSWELPAGWEPAGADGSGDVLPVREVAEMREMWGFRERGKNGADDPLTSEQELRATTRRTTR